MGLGDGPMPGLGHRSRCLAGVSGGALSHSSEELMETPWDPADRVLHRNIPATNVLQ